MADIIDLAQVRVEELRDDALAERQRSAVSGKPLPWPRDCASCGDPIPLARAEAQPAADNCVECQTHQERPRR
jgi:phage/conjugal plasmid C-4 type zinc finger TraR family protein